MALERELKIAVRKVVQALHEFARQQNPPWRFARDKDFSQGDYYIDVVVNVDWFRIYVIFVAKGFRNRDGYERFEEVQNYLREKFRDDPGLLQSINLVVKDSDQYLSEGDFPPGASDERIDEDFIEKYFSMSVGQN